ncbi:GspE/PulE family protein [Ectothiorhodospira lacustris]|uniref:GspE/PulE family protein n=1 Tax=Ectothiorhodospira lacustris TaxID=2899127 RepID=UPI002377F6CA|nr:type II/IV secretion system protein [Ectothiorhodospira lacustris]
MSSPRHDTPTVGHDPEHPALIGQRLLAGGLITRDDLTRALDIQQRHGDRLGAILVRLGALSEDSLLPVLAAQTGYPLMAATDIPRDQVAQALQALDWTADQLTAHGLILWQDTGGDLCAAGADPLNAPLQEAVQAAAGTRPVRWHFMRVMELERLLPQLAGSGAPLPMSAEHYRELAEDAPVIAFVNSLIAQAIDERASDIHVEPGERACQIRYRIDGVLHLRNEFPVDRFPAVASRIKLIAHLDIAERRLPQDGRITLRASGAEMDMRVSVIPAVHGESIVMRLLPKQREDLALPALGLEPDHLHLLQHWMQLPSGMILVTGPTGSGKSTTLYAALAAVTDQRRKIITVEDPVEHQLPGVIQIQVQAEIGYTFARALRAILRHDPDIIMIGEIRDRETAEIAIQSALTGHLVLATLHTNDALSAFTRLVDMGIEPYLVAAATRAVMAQRLVRRLCPRCARPASPPADTGPAAAEDHWHEAAGCPHCQQTGYRGRQGIYELVSVDAPLRHAVATLAQPAELERLANAAGRRSLRRDGLLKARRGETSVAEVVRVAGIEGEP